MKQVDKNWGKLGLILLTFQNREFPGKYSTEMLEQTLHCSEVTKKSHVNTHI